MKKNTIFFKTISFIAVVFVMAQGCIPTTPVGGNPTPNPNLIGKIKSASATLISIDGLFMQNDLNYSFEYDSLSRISGIKITASVPEFNHTFYVEYLSNTVVVKDSTGITGLIYFLKSGTNLIDSIYDYHNGQQINTIAIERELSNNIQSITFTGRELIKGRLIDFIYEDGSIKNYTFMSYDGFYSTVSNYEVSYDASKPKRPGTAFNLCQFDVYSPSLSTIIFDADIFGLSFGNTSMHSISSLTWNESVDLSYQSGTYDYNYNNFTSNNIAVTATASSSGPFIARKFVCNHLVNVKNEYY